MRCGSRAASAIRSLPRELFQILFVLIRGSPRSTLFPYTTLFRSDEVQRPSHTDDAGQALGAAVDQRHAPAALDRKSTRLNSSHVETSYAVFCLKKKSHGHDGHRRVEPDPRPLERVRQTHR